MTRPVKPATMDAPGLTWRKRSSGWVAYWVARADIVQRGYAVKSARLWSADREPDADDWAAIASQCRKLQTEMLEWSNGSAAAWDPRALYEGSLASLIDVYLRDQDSPFQELRYHSKQGYESKLNALRAAVGAARIPLLSFRDFKRWHEGFAKPLLEGEPLRLARAHGLMTMVRIVISFGALLKLPGCRDARETLEAMEFPMPKARTAFVTAGQADAIRREAQRQGLPSIALAQAFQFELMIRQKDVIGEWVPIEEPGFSDVTYAAKKWMHGLHWQRHIDGNLILTKQISKSLKGRKAVLNPTGGKLETFDLKAYPMIMEELAYVPIEQRSGPVILDDRTGLPWRKNMFGNKWRAIADAAGVPRNVQNRDSRAGGVTEAFDSGAAPDQVRRHATHSQLSTTMRYSRDSIEAKNNVASIRSAKRKPK